MRKTIYLLLAVIILSLVILGCSKASAPAQKNVQSTDSSSDSSGSAESSGDETEIPKFTTLKQVMKLGTSFECDFDQDGITINTKIKGENFASKAASSEGIVNSIVKGKMMYTWVEGQRQGYKMNLEDVEKTPQAVPKAQPNYDEEIPDLDCRSASISDSTFNPPSNVEFQDMSELFAELGGLSG